MSPRVLKTLIIAPTAILSIALLLTAESDQQKRTATNNAVSAASMVTARSGACSANLADGRVLITGGTTSNGLLAGSQIFDAKHGSVDAGQMSSPRANHVCAALPGGRVLVAGGTTF